MTDHAEIRHRIARVDGAPPGTSKARLGLSPLDLLALDQFVRATPDAATALHGQVVAWANALYDRDDRDNARMRMLARAIATTRAKCLLLESKRDECLTRRDAEGVLLLQKVLLGETRQLALLMAEHRLACATERRAAVNVAIGHVGAVNIAAGGRGEHDVP